MSFFTPEQRDAVTTLDQNLVVEAGAGSGKTHVLVNRYLTLLEFHADWPLNALVAITFTKKAAAEMRDRVRELLAERQHEAERWAQLLGQMDSARVDTIHGLCADLLRANAAEAGLDPEFQVLDEVEAAILLDDVIDATLTQIVEDPAYGHLLPLLTYYPVNQISDVLHDAALLNAELPPLPDDVYAAWQTDFAVEIARFCEWADEALTDISPAPPDDKLTEHVNAFVMAFDRLRADPLDSEAFDLLASIKVNVGSAKNWSDAERLQLAKDTLRDARDRAKNFLRLTERDHQAAELLPLWYALIREVQTAYTQAKRQDALLDFEDLEILTSQLLDSDSVRLRYRGEEFKHLLVDEFQDTNARQWQIVQRLGDLATPGTLFVVGDPKQSIYAFRGADVSVFQAVKQQITATGGREVFLSQSFRTHKPLVDALNTVFAHLLVQDEESEVKDYQITFGDGMRAERESPHEDACIEFLMIPNLDGDGNKLKADARHTWEAQEIAARLRAMIDAGQPVYDKKTHQTRPMRYGDVALLFQALTNVGLYEEAFKAWGIPYYTVAGRGYYDRQEVWDVLNLLQAVYHPMDNLALASVLRSPMFGLSDEALLALRLGENRTLWEALAMPAESFPEQERERGDFARACLDELRAVAGRVSIAELIRHAMARTGYLATLSALPNGDQRRSNVEKLIDKAVTSGRVTLGAFTHAIRDLSEREAREGEAPVAAEDVVKLMSVHASKGLEFPIVVLVDCGRKGRNPRSPLTLFDPTLGLGCKVYDPDAEGGKSLYTGAYAYRRIKARQEAKEAAERLRLLYVAATRAQDHLIFSGLAYIKTDHTWSAGGWLTSLIEVFEVAPYSAPDYVCDVGNMSAVTRVTVAQALPTPPTRDKSAQAVPSSQMAERSPLLRNVKVEPVSFVRHLAATHIADLGSAENAPAPQDAYYRARFRRQVLHDAPAQIETVTAESQTIKPYQIGEMVHQALQHGHVPGKMSAERLSNVLKAYAWRIGITRKDDVESAIEQANRLLQQVTKSALYQDIDTAEQVYREMPFIYQRGDFVIHGVIDVVFRDARGQWVIVDYKTSTVARATTFEQHARRYHLQMGVYAAALQAQLGGELPQTLIHYIRHGQTVTISAAEREFALEGSLETRIRRIMREDKHDD